MSSSRKENRAFRFTPSMAGDGARATPLADDLVLFTVEAPASAVPIASSAPGPGLSPTEWEIVRLAMLGLSNPEIAGRRRSSPRTVANHLASAYRKLGVSGRRELRAFLLGRGADLAREEEP
jgi:DNA-binding CsgD family transcriptional regulator